MGVFAVIGLVIGVIALRARNLLLLVLALLVFGVGVAGDTWEHKPAATVT